MGLLSILDGVSHVSLRARGMRAVDLATPAGRVHAYVGRGRGTLPPVVLVHGIGASAASFAPIVARLLPHVRAVIAPELPGHGRSATPYEALAPERVFEVMTGVLDRLIDEPAIVCGNSLGGGVALHHARSRPERVRGLVLLSPAGARMSEAELEEVRRVFHLRTRADAIAFLQRVVHTPPAGASLIASDVQRLMARAVVRGILDAARPDHGLDPEVIAELAMPVTLMWGRSERVLPASSLAYFRAHLPPHARVLEPERAGHCPHLDRPGLVTRTILEVAREPLTGSGGGGARAPADALRG